MHRRLVKNDCHSRGKKRDLRGDRKGLDPNPDLNIKEVKNMRINAVKKGRSAVLSTSRIDQADRTQERKVERERVHPKTRLKRGGKQR